MKCPYCATHIDEHPALPCLNAWIAHDIMEIPTDEIYKDCNRITQDGFLCEDYSGSVAAAWEVVEKLAENNILLHLARRRWGYMQWKAYFIHADFVGLPDAGFRDEAPTAPLAICRAAIKAKNG